MIYVFVGADGEKRKRALSAFLKTKNSTEVIRFDDLSTDVGALQNFIGGSDLFAKEYSVILDRAIGGSLGEQVKSRLESLSESKNIFVIVEEAIEKATLDSLKKYAEKIESFDSPKGKDDRFNIFQITDAFGARDKKGVWVLMQRALRENISSEEILNILIWQTKNLLFVKDEKDIKKTGLSPFVYNKSRRYSENFALDELQKISRKLTTLFHESHLGLDLSSNLELFVLKSL